MPAVLMGRRPEPAASAEGITRPTIVDLPERERDQLAALSRQQGVAPAEAIRQALRLWLQPTIPHSPKGA